MVMMFTSLLSIKRFYSLLDMPGAMFWRDVVGHRALGHRALGWRGDMVHFSWPPAASS